MRIRDATDAEIGRILEGTHPLWSDGLDRRDYQGFIRAMMGTPWARGGGYRFVVMTDADGDPVCAMKLYRLQARLEGARISLGGVGAVFTFPGHRRQGHAATLMAQAHAWMEERGDAGSLLHSEIGAGYYERLGYRALDPDAVALPVPAASPGPEAGLRMLDPMAGDGLERLMTLRRDEDAGLPFALERDAAYWEVLLARAATPGRHLGRDRWESRIVLHPQGGFLWSLLRDPAACAHDGGAAARVMEFAERTPGASLPGLMDDLFGACRSRGITTIESWRGGDLARRDPRLEPRAIRPPAVVPMWRPLDREKAPALQRALHASRLHVSEVF